MPLKLAMGLSVALFGNPNSMSTFSSCVADWLNWTMSAVGAFSRADTAAGDDSTGEFTVESVCSKLATPGLSDETEPIATPPLLHIGGSLDHFKEFIAISALSLMVGDKTGPHNTPES